MPKCEDLDRPQHVLHKAPATQAQLAPENLRPGSFVLIMQPRTEISDLCLTEVAGTSGPLGWLL